MAGRTRAGASTLGDDTVDIVVYGRFHNGVAILDLYFPAFAVGQNKYDPGH
jgi:hypothetical protein